MYKVNKHAYFLYLFYKLGLFANSSAILTKIVLCHDSN